MNDLLKEMLYHMQLADLHSRYFRAIDEKRLDAGIVEATFTADARIVKPNGAVSIGYKAILEGLTASFSRFRATQHITTDLIIGFDDDHASVRLNLTAMHVWGDIRENPALAGKQFHAGGVLETRAVLREDEWRIVHWVFRNVWRAGEGFEEMARFARPQD